MQQHAPRVKALCYHEDETIPHCVKSTLLGDSASWLKRLGRGGESIDGFLAAVNRAREDPVEGAKSDKFDDSCTHCGQSLRTDCLPGGGHHCRMLVTFRCPD